MTKGFVAGVSVCRKSAPKIFIKEGREMRRIFGVCLAVTMLFSGQAIAGGGQSYPNGAEAFMSGAIPPPGVYFLDYL